MAARRFTPEQHERIAALREAGRSYGQIALAVGCSESTAYWVCLKLGAEHPRARPLRPRALGPAVVKRGAGVVRRFTAREDARILALEAQGLSVSAIARAIGRRHNSVRARLMTLARHEARAEAA